MEKVGHTCIKWSNPAMEGVRNLQYLHLTLLIPTEDMKLYAIFVLVLVNL